MSPRAPHRFYYPGSLAAVAPGAALALSAEESRHILRVLRLRPGAPLELFDAAGRAWSAELLAGHGEDAATVRLLGPLAAAEPGADEPAIHLAVAVIKRNPLDWMIEKLSELGVQTLQPLLTARSIGQGDIKPHSAPPERWDRIAIAAAKQCGRNRPLAFEPPAPLAEWLAQPRPAARQFVAQPAPDAPPLGQALAPPESGDAPAPVWIAIGPEGGWTLQEQEAFVAAGFQPVRLGHWILRTETAAITAAGICQSL